MSAPQCQFQAEESGSLARLAFLKPVVVGTSSKNVTLSLEKSV